MIAACHAKKIQRPEQSGQTLRKEKIMQRTILCTVVEDPVMKVRSEIYGRYDAVALQRKGLKIVDSYKQLFVMDDATFARYGKRKEEKEK